MTSPTVRLIYGGRKLNLNDQTSYGIYPDFTPPEIAFNIDYAGGTSANKSGAALSNISVANTPFEFRVNVLGTGDADIRRKVGKMRSFLSLAEDKSDTLYLEFNSNSNAAQPLWGQNHWVRFPIAYGTVSYDAGYMVGNSLSTDIDATISIVIKGYPEGLKQRLALASGGVGEDVIGSPHGASRGLQVSVVSPTGGNEFTNPVFGNATWDTGWTADASLTAEQNTDPEFCLPGTTSSARLTSRATNQEFYDAINTGDTNTHAFSCYAKLPDGGTVSSTHVVLFYSTTLTTTFTSVGDGWYRLTATASGINASTNAGVQVKTGYTVYVSGFQMEESAYSTPLFYGDLLGCAWSGTAHDSASTRAVGMCKVPISSDTFKAGAMSVRLVVKFWCDNTFSGDIALFDATDAVATAAPHLYFSSAADDFRMDMGGVSIDSAAQTFSVGDVIVLHFTGDETNGVAIYKNGASIASSASFNPAVLASYFFIGSNYDGTALGPMTIMDCTTWDVCLTSTEVLNDYNNIAQVAADSERVGAIPYLWNKDGDGVTDNCDDSTRDNWFVGSGIPGSAPALTSITGSLASNFLAQTGIWINNNPMSRFVIPTGNYFFDYSGTVVANTCGGEVTTTASVTTAAAALASTTLTGRAYIEPLYGKNAYMFVRMADNGSNLTLALSISIGGESQIISEYRAVTTDATYRSLLVGPVFVPDREFFDISGLNTLPTLTIALYGKRTTGSGTTLIDYTMLYVDQCCKVPSLGATSTSSDSFRIFDGRAIIGSSARARGIGAVLGKTIEFFPGKANVLTFLLNDDGAASTVSATANSIRAEVTPRYSVL